uniref:Uncharacterized protein n=1 Tax=Cannabis sativa TaxID=3483 RepID=A0A803NPQ1_CANSA
MKEAIQRSQIIGEQSSVAISHEVSGDHEEAIPRAVNDESEGGVTGHVSIFDQRNFAQNSLRRVVVGDSELGHGAGEGGDEESTVVIVPLGALAEPAWATVKEDGGGWGGVFKGDEVGDGYGGEDEEDEERLE